jgi:hypothetical protein
MLILTEEDVVSVRNQVESQVWIQVHNQVWRQVRDQVYANFN